MHCLARSRPQADADEAGVLGRQKFFFGVMDRCSRKLDGEAEEETDAKAWDALCAIGSSGIAVVGQARKRRAPAGRMTCK